MKQKKTLIIVLSILITIVAGLLILNMAFRNQYEYYKGDIVTYKAECSDEKYEYSFQLDTFIQEKIHYISLNDLYNYYLIQDETTKVSLDQKEAKMVFSNKRGTVTYDYGNQVILLSDEIKVSDEIKKQIKNHEIKCSDVTGYLFIHEKELFIPLDFTKILIDNYELSLNNENKTAIIE